ncbi:MAG: hypothetical protein MRY49_02625 [Candidatus Pacebacteria bacterium]|nr:hypothetical protein [Candidatus Paceibacterota bacterium]
MKASDYAKQWIALGSSQSTLPHIMARILEETQTLIDQRGARSERALLAVLREMDQKWKAFARHFPEGKVDPMFFRTSIMKNSPELISSWGKIWPTTTAA